jgi:hypothetical protein
MLVKQGHRRDSLEHCFWSAGSDLGNIEATVLSHLVRNTLLEQSFVFAVILQSSQQAHQLPP